MFRRDLSTGIRHCDLRFLDTTRNNNSRGPGFCTVIAAGRFGSRRYGQA
jgi:hypothetical protein